MATRLDALLSGADEAAEYIARHAFGDDEVGAVGLELESHSVDLAHPDRRVSWQRLQEIAASIGPLPGASTITFEPGGAVELSGPPHPDISSAITAMRADRQILARAFRAAGVALAALGTDPLRAPERVNPSPRYTAMARHFDAAGRGEPGAQMMTLTASLQVNLQSGRRKQWRDRFDQAQRIGPTLVALSASSPMLAGQATGWRNTRQRIWGRMDPRRCGPVSIGDDPAESWARYALQAPVMLARGSNGDANAVVDDVPFSAWVEGQVMVGDRRPTTEDLDYHLTTLFPPVRPRGWFELRYLDAAPDFWWPALAFTATAVLDHPAAAEIAAEAVEPVGDAWETAARVGLADDGLRSAACRLVAAACSVAPDALLPEMLDLLGRAEQGRCPADDFTDNVAEYGVVQAFSGVTLSGAAQ
ncbi:ergothioneine biosynthesis glutamate--cysteine ligase EgtA [Mycobacterium sp. CBMA271]|uniref:ergothioneine biosynthesis glutamate--cysteine ligase EgtA n=1 Tax=unclassified Mycobacteroides TaxID=2618759 RepID=UPI0012DCC805|nr:MULTISPECIES: ergothioneine biosynthesis glutamate--cysteine ligase EgtA [unclassified Mycobacteroides]MUM19688.1 ergothioneine biosynthesis glutamate--cysteine ligase EgtA [Mycobacteroides sp. CBMA 326]MUM24292.1 ergothioneine biosynthesis glutamate--cysteine ligase EgtA [Mycobacteroides sp. CBMA 271]